MAVTNEKKIDHKPVKERDDFDRINDYTLKLKQQINKMNQLFDEYLKELKT